MIRPVALYWTPAITTPTWLCQLHTNSSPVLCDLISQKDDDNKNPKCKQQLCEGSIDDGDNHKEDGQADKGNSCRQRRDLHWRSLWDGGSYYPAANAGDITRYYRGFAISSDHLVRSHFKT